MIRNTIPQDRGIGRLNRRVKPEGHGWPETQFLRIEELDALRARRVRHMDVTNQKEAGL